jgi:hypothetical protein
MSRKTQFLAILRTAAFTGLLAITFLAIASLSGCGGGSGGSGGGGGSSKSVSASAAATTVDANDTTTVSASVTNDSNSAGVTWSVSGGGALSAQTTSSATYTAPAATNAAQTATITATSVADPTKSATATITVPAAVSVTTAALPDGPVGAAYSQPLAASGGIPPYTWTITGGTLPTCLTMNSAGVLSGTPTSACVGTSSNLTFKVTDSGTATPLSATSAALSLNVAPAPAISLPAPGPLSGGVIGTPYTASVAATGGAGALTYTISAGALPTGLTISAAGTVAGTPTVAGPFNFTVKASDAFGDSQTQAYSIQINYPAVTIAPAAGALPIALTGTAYSQSLTAGGGSGAGFVWTVAGLPSDGLTATANGAALLIAGSPTSAANVSFTASATDGVGNKIGPFTYTIAVYTPISLPATDPPSLPANSTINTAYTGTITATGGSGAGYTWTVTGLSDGLTSSNTGGTLTISGTPTTASTVTFMASVKDSVGNTAGPTTYTINAYSAITLPAPNPLSLGNGILNRPYSGTVSVGGGSGSGYVWTVTGFPSNGLTYTTNGSTLTVTGTPTSLATVSFNATVKDSLNNSTGPINYTIAVFNALTLPAPNPNTLPSNQLSGSAYNGTIVAAGGSGSGYVFTVTGLSNGLNFASNGATLTISGTPAAAGTVTFNVSVKDGANNSIGPLTYSIVFYAPLTLPFANPGTLPSAAINQAYQGSIIGGGGVAPYTWFVNGTALPNDGSSVAIAGGQGLTVSSTGTNTLSFAGTPTAIATVSFPVKLTDSIGNHIAPPNYSINIDAAGGLVSGQIQVINNCSGATFPPIFNLSINTTPPQQTTTDNTGSYSFSGIPNGTYTVTPSLPGPSSLFVPANQANIVVNNSSVTGVDFNVAFGYTVSGNVSYSGAKTGQVYLTLQGSACGVSYGTSIPFSALGSGGAFTIHGVAPGTYTLNASVDNLGSGASNAANPTGTTANLNVSNANLTGQAVTITDPFPVVPSSAPNFKAITPANLGAVIQFTAIKNNGIEQVTDYQLQWSTDSTFNTGIINSETFKATGTGSNIWFLNNSTAGITGTAGSFVNGTAYYFRLRGRLSAGNSPWAVFGGGTPTAVTIGAPAGGNTVSGTVTIPAGITIAGPLYAGFYDQTSGAVYVDRIANPGVGANPYTVQVPTSTDAYINFGVLDQNNDGIIDTGDVSNTNDTGISSNGIVINTSLTNQNLTLPSVNSTAIVQTQFFSNTNGGGTFTSYQLSFNIREANKLPVAVQLISGPNVLSPVDIAACSGCGHVQFQTFESLGNIVPNVGDTYAFSVTYSDGTTQTVNGLVTSWGSGATIVGSSDLATNLAPVQTNSNSVTPTFTWDQPANASSYTYQFQIDDDNNTTLWNVPSQNSNLNGFPSTITQIAWPTDPTDGTNTPSVATLTQGTQYQWWIEVQDVNGNSATSQVYYIP